MSGIYDIRNIVAMQLKKLGEGHSLDSLFVLFNWDCIDILTTGGYIQYSRQELLNNLQVFIDELAAEESEEKPETLYVVHCGEPGYFQTFKSATDLTPAFTHNIDNAFVYNHPGMGCFAWVVDQLQQLGYVPVIVKKEDTGENNTV